jgi:transcriptional regulator with XRE-family HTH domain
MSYSDDEVRAAFGRVLVGIRKRKNITREVAARRHGFVVSSLLNWERGAVGVSIDNLFRIGRAYNIKPSRMMYLIEFQLSRRNQVDQETNEDA